MIPYDRAKYLTISNETMQINDIRKHINQSNPVKYMNLKLTSKSGLARKTWTPGISLSAIRTKNNNPINRYMNLLLSSFILLNNDLFGRLI